VRNRRLLAQPSDATFLQEAYRCILGRDPDTGGFRFFLNSLQAGGMTRANVIAALEAAVDPNLARRLPTWWQQLLRVAPAASDAARERYRYQCRDATLRYGKAVRLLSRRVPNRVHKGPVNGTDEAVVEEISQALAANGVAVRDLHLDTGAYHDYLARAGYAERYPDYYRGNVTEKSVEHFLGYQLLGSAAGQRFVDIASEHSPVPEIYERLSGCEAYAQDLMFPEGLHGRRIGGDAGKMALPDGFLHGALASCSLEHFEGDADTRFMIEMERTLAPGGSLVVVPLYMYTAAAIQTDPLYAVPAGVQFDRDAEIFCTEGWGNRHGRFYSAATLVSRLIRPCRRLAFTAHRLRLPADLAPSVYCRFLLQAVHRPV
jgi:hypothetical protein